MTQTLRRERKQKFLAILELAYQDNPWTQDAHDYNVRIAEKLADAAMSKSELAIEAEYGEPKPNIYKIYEENIGALTPMIADELKEIEDIYPDGWFKDAVSEALKNNVRKLSYVKTVLSRWKIEGKSGKKENKISSMFETLT